MKYNILHNKYYLIYIYIISSGSFLCGQTLSGKPAIVANASMPNPCNLVVNAGPDITVCEGSGKMLDGDVSGSNFSFEWTPADGLDDPTALKPTASPSMTTTYTLTAMATSDNLINNGDFENGSIAPGLTNYVYVPDAVQIATNYANNYTIIDYPAISAQFGCDTRGTYSLVIHGSSGTTFWCQTIPVSPNTDYKLSFWLMSVLNFFFTPTIQLKINNTVVGSKATSGGICSWDEFTGMWNSGAATSATICLINTTSGGLGNICAIDDISMKACCVEKDQVRVEVFKLNISIQDPGEINCRNRPLRLNGQGSSSGPGISYEWTTQDGVILSGANTLNPVIDAPGTYTLKIKGPNGCEKEESITVDGNVLPPDIILTNTDLSCAKPTAKIEVRSATNPVDIIWTGPDNYFSSDPVNDVTQEGDYDVVVTDQYGCETKGKVTVKDFRSSGALAIQGDTISCSKDSALLKVTHQLSKPDFSWYHEGSKISDTSFVVVRDTGYYYVFARDSSGCITKDSFYVLDFKSNILIDLVADTIDCLNLSVKIYAIVPLKGQARWTGPNQFLSYDMEPTVSDSGWYFIHFLSDDGCIGEDSIFIVKSADVPDIFVSKDDTLNCLQKQVLISGGSNTAGIKKEWMGPNGIIGDLDSFPVLDPGEYILFVEGSNGCLINKSVNISVDTAHPLISLTADTITCRRSNSRISITEQKNDTSSIVWTGPSQFSANHSVEFVMQAGMYKVVVTALNGCAQTDSIRVNADTSKPDILLSFDSIDCKRLIAPVNLVGDSTQFVFEWNGPGGFSSSNADPGINKGGIYQLKITGKNGCENNYQFAVFEDRNIAPIFTSADTISCGKTAYIELRGAQLFESIEWSGPGGFSSLQAKTPVTDSGWYFIKVIGLNGCEKTDSIFVFQKDKLPDIFAFDDSLTCNRTQVILQGGSATNGVSFEWSGPGFFSRLRNPLVDSPGIYTLKVIDPNGCVSEKQIEVFLRKKSSELFIIKSDTVINCINNGIQISGLAGELLTDYYWTTPGNIIIKDSTIRANGGGWYKYFITNQWGCSVSDSIFINDIRMLPQVQIPDTSINCLTKEQQINPISAEKNLQFSWMGPGGFQSNISNPIISIPGIYLVSITNAAGCRLVEQVVLSADTSGPVLKVAKQDISCQRDSAFVLMSSDKSNTQYAWSGPQSFLSNSDRFSTVDTGTYLCIATDPQNGCSTLITIDIKKDTNNIKNIELTQDDNYCNKSTGSIRFKDIIGGTEPLLYSIDGGKSFSNSELFENLPAGIYELVIQDANGCSFSRQIEIKDILGHKVALATEIILSLDEKKTIQIQSSSDSTAFVNILWSPSDQLSCENCWSPVVTGTKDETIYLTVADTNGCTYQSQINIKINQEAFISIPNIFSPNGDRINDYFYPQGNEQIQIELFEVYDRWGGLVFRTSEAKINVPEDGWNGTYKGALLNPAVFVYVIKAKHPLQEWILSGEITLIR